MISADSALSEHLPPPVTRSEVHALADLVGLRRDVEIVEVGASPLVGEPARYTVLLEAEQARVTGFEPDRAAYLALQERASSRERYLDVALGDGADHVLRVCVEPGFSSLLEPDSRQLAVLTDFDRLARPTDRKTVATRRLDDVPEVRRADLLCLDVQGSEPSVLDGAQRVLASAFAVQTEVAFHRLYEGGPTWCDVDGRLRAAGFVPHAFVSTRTWPLAPVTWDDPLQAHARHLVEADLLYVRDPTCLTGLASDLLEAGILIAACAYGSLGLALVCLRELRRRGRLSENAEHRFREIVTPGPRQGRS